MTHGVNRLRRRLQGVVGLGAMLALLCVIALTSSARTGGQALGPNPVGLAVLLIAGVVVIATAASGLAIGSHTIFAGTQRRTKLLTGAVLVLALTALVAATLIGADRDPSPISTTEFSGSGVATRERPQSRREHDWAEEVAAGALFAAFLIVAVAIAAAELRRRRASLGRDDFSSDEIRQAVTESLDELRKERDVRRAIIACYARMERALARVGAQRRPAEAPFEYLVRILERITANGSAARALTDLFERAKFSVEPLGEADKRAAISALELLRAEVRPRT